MRYSRSHGRLCVERGDFLTELLSTNPIVAPNFGFTPDEAAVYVDARSTNMRVVWKNLSIEVPLARVFEKGNVPKTQEFAPLRSQLDSWFNDEIINMYLNITHHQLHPEHFCYFNSFFGSDKTKRKSAAEAAHRLSKNVKRNGGETCQRVAIPFNIGNSHWVLFYVVRSDAGLQVYYYDSKNDPYTHRTYRTLNELLDELYGENTQLGDPGFYMRTGLNVLCKSWGWKEDGDLPTTKVGFKSYQTDDINCGVFVCLVASLLMSGHRPEYMHDTAFAYTDILRMRMRVYNTLRPHAVPYQQAAAASATTGDADSDIEEINPPEAEAKPKGKGKAKAKGGTRVRRFFSRRLAYHTRHHDRHGSKGKRARFRSRSRRLRVLGMS